MAIHIYIHMYICMYLLLQRNAEHARRCILLCYRGFGVFASLRGENLATWSLFRKNLMLQSQLLILRVVARFSYSEGLILKSLT